MKIQLINTVLLSMLLFSQTAQEANSFSLASLTTRHEWSTEHRQQSPGRYFMGIGPLSRLKSIHLFGYSGDAEAEEYEIKGDNSSPKEWSADDLLPYLPSAATRGRWELSNDFYSFLNQCSIQSFLFLLKSLRDPQTVRWLEDYTQTVIELDKTQHPASALRTGGISETSKLLNYHGLAAMNTTRFPTWKSYFAQLLEEPIATYVIESPLPQVPDYDLEIKPSSLCSRLVSIRQQVGAEFAKDLSVIAEMGGHTLESYWDSLKELKQRREEETARKQEQDALDEEENKAKPGATGNEAEQHHDNNNHNFDVRRHNLMFLDLPADTSSGVQPSPLRKGNFDLLTLLTTQEAIHRVLNDDEDEDEDEPSLVAWASKKYLRDFYIARIPSHFAGNQRYGQADAFLAELLAEVPTMKLSVDDDDQDDVSSARAGTSASLNLIDPTHIAQVVMEKRREVALEWEQLARQVPDEHLEIKRLQLNMLMTGGHFGGGRDSSGDSSSSSSSTAEAGAAGDTTMTSFEEALRARHTQDDHNAAGVCPTAAAMAAAFSNTPTEKEQAPASAEEETQVAEEEEAPAVHKRNRVKKKKPNKTTSTPLKTVPVRQKKSVFARSIQERKKAVSARARVTVASMAVPERQKRVMMVPERKAKAPMSGQGFGKKNMSMGTEKESSFKGSAAAAAPAVMSRPPVMAEKTVSSSTMNEKKNKTLSSSSKTARAAAAAKDRARNKNHIIKLKNSNNKSKKKRKNKRLASLFMTAIPAPSKPFNRTSVFE